MRHHAGQDVHAGGEPLSNDRPSSFLRLDNGWIGRIDENRSFHGNHRQRAPAGCDPMRRSASRHDRIAFVASPSPSAERARKRLVARYGDAPIETADTVVALGGDGLM